MVDATDNYGVGALGRVQLVDEEGAVYKASIVNQTVEGGDIDTTSLAKETKQDTAIARLNDIYAQLGAGIDVTVLNPPSNALPAGAATSALQGTGNTSLGHIESLLGQTLAVNVQNSSIPVTATGLPLPSGAATAAKQDDEIAAIGALTTQLTGTTRNVNVTNSSIPITDNGGSLTVDATSLPLPAGASTASKQDAQTALLTSISSSVAGNQNVAVTSTVVTPVTDNGGSLTVDGAVTVSNFPTTQPVSAASLPLPDGAATDASLQSGNTSLAGILTASSDNTASGTITAINQGVAISTAGKDSLAIQVSGGYTGALTPQATVDGTNWFTIAGQPLYNVTNNSSLATVPSATTGIFVMGVGGFTQLRLQALAAVSGTATVTLRATSAANFVSIDTPLPAGSNTIGTVSVTGTVTTNEAASTATATAPSQVATSTTSATLAASLSTRKAVVIYNNSTVNLYIAFATSASLTAYTTQLVPNGTLVVPRETWSGAISGILPTGATASTANVTVTA